mmetsp:Transcript_30201/g.71882  ORF Transcript_30201/g.71882 Transcript_30201/m.71882 type:complete len:241 (+) Transcript_30201:1800-2522(+)
MKSGVVEARALGAFRLEAAEHVLSPRALVVLLNKLLVREVHRFLAALQKLGAVLGREGLEPVGGIHPRRLDVAEGLEVTRDLLHGPEVQHPSLVEQYDLVEQCHSLGRGLQEANDAHRVPHPGHLPEELANVVGRRGVEACAYLVEAVHVGPGGHHLGDRHPLLFAARYATDPIASDECILHALDAHGAHDGVDEPVLLVHLRHGLVLLGSLGGKRPAVRLAIATVECKFDSLLDGEVSV